MLGDIGILPLIFVSQIVMVLAKVMKYSPPIIIYTYWFRIFLCARNYTLITFTGM